MLSSKSHKADCGCVLDVVYGDNPRDWCDSTFTRCRLHSAATDLLAACEKSLSFIENTEGEFGIVLDTGIMLSAAIRKAKLKTHDA